MFPNIQREIDERFGDITSHFKRATTALKPHDTAVRGLVFVQIYAVYENIVNQVVQRAAEEIAAHGHTYNTLKPQIQSLFLDSELRSVQETANKKVWESRIVLLQKSRSNDPIVAPLNVIPNDRSHYRYSNLLIIFRVFDVRARPVAHKKHSLRVDEVVENRNAIAHGRETAEAIGRRYTRRDIERRIDQMRRICTRLVSVFEKHCKDPSNHCN